MILVIGIVAKEDRDIYHWFFSANNHLLGILELLITNQHAVINFLRKGCKSQATLLRNI